MVLDYHHYLCNNENSFGINGIEKMKLIENRDCLSSSVFKTPQFYCKGSGFDPCIGKILWSRKW